MGIFSHASDYISISKAEWEGKKTPMCWENFEMSRSTKTAPQIFLSFNTYFFKKILENLPIHQQKYERGIV